MDTGVQERSEILFLTRILIPSERKYKMKKLIIPLSILFLVYTIPLQAQINGKRWFAELSAGGCKSRGSFEMNRFYDPTFSLSLDFGYMLTPHIGIIPVSVSYYGFRFDKQNYIDNYWDYKDEYSRRLWEELLEEHPGGYYDYNISLQNYRDISTEIMTDFNALSSLWYVSFTPGLVFFSPELAGLRSFCQVGAGIYDTRIWIKSVTTYGNLEDEWNRNISFGHLKDRKINFGMLLSGGVEYDFTEKVALTFKLRYNLVFTGEKKKIAKIRTPDGLRFYYLTENGLQFHRFLEEKDMRVVEFTGGLKLYF